MYEKDLKAFLELLAPGRDERILDVGAGLCTIADSLTSHCDDVFALEPDETKVEYARIKHRQVKVFSATASQIPFPESYFDKLYVIVAFHHFPDQDDALEEFRRVTKASGILLIHELDPSERGGKILRFFEAKILRNHAIFVKRDDLKKLLEEHGFSVLEERVANRGYFVLSKNAKSSDESRGWIDF